MKRKIAILLVVVLMLVSMPVTGWAAPNDDSVNPGLTPDSDEHIKVGLPLKKVITANVLANIINGNLEDVINSTDQNIAKLLGQLNVRQILAVYSMTKQLEKAYEQTVITADGQTVKTFEEVLDIFLQNGKGIGATAKSLGLTPKEALKGIKETFKDAKKQIKDDFSKAKNEAKVNKINDVVEEEQNEAIPAIDVQDKDEDDDNDVKEIKDAKDIKEIKDVNDDKDVKDVKDVKDKDHSELKGSNGKNNDMHKESDNKNIKAANLNNDQVKDKSNKK